MAYSRKVINKNVLHNFIRNSDAHNKIQEEKEMWRLHKISNERKYRKSPTHRRKIRHDDHSSKDSDKQPKDTYWMKELTAYESSLSQRWGHNGYMEMYPEEFQENDKDTSESENERTSRKKHSKRERRDTEKRKHKSRKDESERTEKKRKKGSDDSPPRRKRRKDSKKRRQSVNSSDDEKPYKSKKINTERKSHSKRSEDKRSRSRRSDDKISQTRRSDDKYRTQKNRTIKDRKRRKRESS